MKCQHLGKLASALAIAAALLLSACGNKTDAPPAASDTAAAKKVIRVATEGAYPPFNDLTAGGKLVGFDVEVINALCTQMAVQCELVAQDWDGIIPGLLANKYDAIIAGMSVTPERAQQVDFSEPYFANTIAWLSKKDGSFDPKNIKNKALGGQRSTTAAAYINEQYNGKNGNRVRLYDTYVNAYLDMKAGRIDAVMAEKVSANAWLKSPENADFALVGDEIDNNDNIAIAVRKGDPLKQRLDNALAHLKESGELARIEAASF